MDSDGCEEMALDGSSVEDPGGGWPGPTPALLTDLYQLTMIQAYWLEEMDQEAVFSLYFRTLPRGRNYMVACGVHDAIRALEALRFSADELRFLATLDLFRDEFLDWLGRLRFRGAVRAVPEGTPVFPLEPLVEVRASIAEAQLAETLLMNQVHFQTVLATKAARVVTAAQGRPVVDFGLRRMYGTDAGLRSARAFYVVGVSATSNVLAGKVWGVPVAGTMAHSYIQAHEEELDAFRAFAGLYPETILLVDTYDTLAGVEKVVELARELGNDFQVSGVRLDSGDLTELARETRRLLDEAGLGGVEIFASGGLDEGEIARLLRAGAPIDGFGVGTSMGVSEDVPVLDMAYKLVAYGGKGRLKLSPGKELFPGAKQVFRREHGGEAQEDVVARADEVHEGRPLLVPVMEDGVRVGAGREPLGRARERAEDEIRRLPERIRALDIAEPPYPVAVSEGLRRLEEELRREVE